jgi:hypothetical protein
MYSLNVPAGCPVQLTATAGVAVDTHRWVARVFAGDDQALGLTPRLSYGSRIGGLDREQHVEIPAQDVDCTLEVGASHRNGNRWDEDQSFVSSDTPSLLTLEFGAGRSSAAHEDDIRLSFQFTPIQEA